MFLVIMYTYLRAVDPLLVLPRDEDAGDEIDPRLDWLAARAAADGLSTLMFLPFAATIAGVASVT